MLLTGLLKNEKTSGIESNGKNIAQKAISSSILFESKLEPRMRHGRQPTITIDFIRNKETVSSSLASCGSELEGCAIHKPFP